jgi:tetratricopeptide (TPR) repeat protein
MPLYNAVAHACKAKQFNEAYNLYWDRIQRGSEGFAHRELGAFSQELVAMASFFSSAPLKESERFMDLESGLEKELQAHILGITGSRLRSLGQLEQACKLLERSIAIYERLPDIDPQLLLRRIRHLSESHFALGNLEEACRHAKRAVFISYRKRSPYDCFVNWCVLGASLHYYSGEVGPPQKAFTKAYQRQMKFDAVRSTSQEVTSLYSLWGFRYWEFLIDQPVDFSDNRKTVIAQVESVKHIPRDSDLDPEQGLGIIGTILEKLSALTAQLGVSPASGMVVEFESIQDQLRKVGRHDFTPYGPLACAKCRRLAFVETGDHAHIREAEKYVRLTWELSLRDNLRVFQAEALIETAELATTTGTGFGVLLKQLSGHDNPAKLDQELRDFMRNVYKRRENWA